MDDVKFDPKSIVPHRDYPGEKEIHIKSGFRISYFQRSAYYGPLNEMKPRSFEYYSICQLIKGEGWYWSEEEGKQFFSVGDGVLTTPGFINSYGGYKSEYIEDYICFSGQIADLLFNCGVIKNGIIKIGQTRRLIPIIKAALSHSDSGQIQANALLQKLLYDLYIENQSESIKPSEDSIDRLLIELKSSPEQWWSVSEMANYCNLSENHFRRKFKERTEMCPKHYFESIKIQSAKEKLLRSDDKLDVIASQLGYFDRYHFSKVFKKVVGISPDQFRKQIV